MTSFSPSSISQRRRLPPQMYELIYFNIGWWLCVWSATEQKPWIAIASTAALLYLILKNKKSLDREIATTALIALLGYGVDYLFMRLGFFHFPHSLYQGSFPPLWLLGMWLQFAATLESSFGAWRRRLWVLALLGAIIGPINYWAGEGFGILLFRKEHWPATLTLTASWAFLLPFFLKISLHITQKNRP